MVKNKLMHDKIDGHEIGVEGGFPLRLSQLRHLCELKRTDYFFSNSQPLTNPVRVGLSK